MYKFQQHSDPLKHVKTSCQGGGGGEGHTACSGMLSPSSPEKMIQRGGGGEGEVKD